MKRKIASLVFIAAALPAWAQTIRWEGRDVELKNVIASVVDLNGTSALKVERDLKALPFDVNRLGQTVDEPTFVKLRDFDFADGIFEVKVLARIQQPSPFKGSQGFIGVSFRIKGDDSAFEAIYLRPNAGRSGIQAQRNRTIQYFAYPDFKFDRLRKESSGLYETYADIGLDEWITMRVHVVGEQAELYLGDVRYASFIVNKMKGKTSSGSIGFFVDIGTEGYFKDFKIISYKPKGDGGV